MKKFHVFAGRNYYPNGSEDYQKSFETIAEAVEYADSLTEDWWEILATEEDGSLYVYSFGVNKI